MTQHREFPKAGLWIGVLRQGFPFFPYVTILKTETIFLTAHSAFDFMKRAIQLDGFDYLLKPVEFDVLQETISKALASIEEERELHQLRKQYKPYYDMWRKKKSLIVDKFWNDLFSGRIVCTPDNAAGILEEHELSDLKDAVFLPVLVSVESWLREFSTKDEEIMEYAVRKGAAEMLLPAGGGEVIQTKQGVNVVVIVGEAGEDGWMGGSSFPLRKIRAELP